MSFVKSPLRRNEITKKLTKNIKAVPKSPISARQMKQNPENSMNIKEFLFSISSSSDAAPTQMKASLTISDGCTESPPMLTQLAAPNFVVPKSRLKISMAAAPA